VGEGLLSRHEDGGLFLAGNWDTWAGDVRAFRADRFAGGDLHFLHHSPKEREEVEGSIPVLYSGASSGRSRCRRADPTGGSACAAGRRILDSLVCIESGWYAVDQVIRSGRNALVSWHLARILDQFLPQKTTRPSRDNFNGGAAEMGKLHPAEISEQEEELFRKWRAKRPDLVRDGAVDPVAYLKSKTKLIFVLKETNSTVNDERDLRKFVREGGRAQTWNNVTRWVAGIRADTPWEELPEINPKLRQEVLRSIVVINLKKSPGGASTVHAELEKAADEDRKLIEQQYLIYSPDITICCGTGKLFREKARLPESPRKATKNGVAYYRYPGKGVIVDYYHPQARFRSAELYSRLLDALREIRGHD
jgi:hypothetical protein